MPSLASATATNRRGHPVLGYPSKTAAIHAMLGEGLDEQTVADRLGMSKANVQRLKNAREGNITDRKVLLPRDVFSALRLQAEMRGTTALKLANQLLNQVVRDDLFDALLGEPGEADG